LEREETPAAALGETGLAEADLTAIRDLILQAHPDVVPELITGTTLTELTGSIEGAKAAYARIAARQPVPPVVPAGGAVPVIDPDRLPTSEKIRRGLKQVSGNR
jgi:hypothetical protein